MSDQPTPPAGPATPPTFTGNDILVRSAPGSVDLSAPTKTGNEILKTAGEVGLSPLQVAGLGLALGVGIFAIVALLALLTVWGIHIPNLPALPASLPQDPQVISDTVKLVETYQLANQAAAEQPLKWFEVLFTNMLYPLLTLILGYIFGASGKNESSG